MPPIHIHLDTLDAFLQNSDADSMGWADGGGAEQVVEMLAALSVEDWPKLQALLQCRSAKWRECLASTLSPGLGVQAGNLMIVLASDPDTEVAFLAACGIALHCGVNLAAHGPFIDAEICQPAFFAQAKASVGLAAQIRQLGSRCAPSFQRRFELLATLLENKA